MVNVYHYQPQCTGGGAPVSTCCTRVLFIWDEQFLLSIKKVLFKRWLTINKHRVEYKCYDEQLSLSTAVYKWGKNPQSEDCCLGWRVAWDAKLMK